MSPAGATGSRSALDDLRNDVIRLAALVTEAIGAGTHALLDADLALVDQVIADDRQINDLNHHIELDAYRLLRDAAADRRDLRGGARGAADPARDRAERRPDGDVAKATRRLYPQELPPRCAASSSAWASRRRSRSRVAVDAFADCDPRWPARCPTWTTPWTSSQKSLFRAILTLRAGRRGHAATRGADGAGRPPLRADRRPRGADRRGSRSW